jgi:hypothetical protein
MRDMKIIAGSFFCSPWHAITSFHDVDMFQSENKILKERRRKTEGLK